MHRQFIKIDVDVENKVSLAATLYCAGTADTAQLTVLKCDPYRDNMDDETGSMFHRLNCNFLYVSVRGTSDSTGSAIDEYSKDEQLDMHKIVSYILKQPWSNGKICLFGISYSACNALHTLLYNNTKDTNNEIKNSIVCAFLMHVSSDHYDNDTHWNHGIFPISDSLQYNFAMTACNMLPRSTGEFDKRLHTPPWISNWLDKNKDSKYWKERKNVHQEEILKTIKIPILLYGGFHDLYCSSVIKLHDQLPCNLTIISHQGHEKPSNLEELFKYWQNVYPTLALYNKKLYYRLGDQYMCTIGTADTGEKTTISHHEFSKDAILYNRLNIGPFFRFTPCNKPSFTEKDGMLQWKFLNSISGICKYPCINNIVLKNPPQDYYLVGWILDENENVVSIGTNRISDGSNSMNISLAPFSISGARTRTHTLTVCLTMSCIPMLMPQFWNKYLHIVSADCTLSFCATSVDSVNIPFPMDLPMELTRYNISTSEDEEYYTISSSEIQNFYKEYFSLSLSRSLYLRSIRDFKFSFKEIYTVNNCQVNVDCNFSLVTDKQGILEIDRRLSGVDCQTLPRLSYLFNL